MKAQPHFIAQLVTLVIFSIPGGAQLTIDATGPHKHPKEVTSGSASGVGRELSLQVSLNIPNPVMRENGKTLVEFILTNSGKEGLEVPIAPDADRVEPSTSATAYTFRSLRLHMTKEGSMPAADRSLPGGANLYGSDSSGTLLMLAPGDTIRVLVEIGLPHTSSQDQNGSRVIAWAVIENVTITTQNGKASLESQEVGYSTSSQYTLGALLKSPN